MGQNCSTCNNSKLDRFDSSMNEKEHYPKKNEAVKVVRMNQSTRKVAENIKIYDPKTEVSEPNTINLPYIGPFKYEGGVTYEGQFFKGLRYGIGEEIDLKGNQYMGNWKNGLKHGHGYYFLANGDVYIGNFENGIYHGKGTYFTDQKATIYDGMWVNGRKEGEGDFLVGDREEYSGEWKDNLRHGKGKRTYPDGSIYKGNFVNGAQEGEGELQKPDGGWYLGNFANNKFNGKGHLFEGDGSENYEGEFLNGEKHGIGITIDAYFNKEKAKWVNGEKVEVIAKYKKGEQPSIIKEDRGEM